MLDSQDLESVKKDLSNNLVEIHVKNKLLFFNCLKDKAIEELGPGYDWTCV